MEKALKKTLKRAEDKKIVNRALAECPRAREELVTQAMIDSVVKRLSDFSPDSDLMKKWRKTQKNREKETDQPRPSNSWLITLNVFRENHSILVPNFLSPALIAPWLSTVTKDASPHFHDRFVEAANIVKKHHQTFFPEYRYEPCRTPPTRSGSKASSARNSISSSESASPSPSSSGSASRSVKSRTARKNASSPYPSHHASRTRSPQPPSGPEYHVASLGSWTDPLPLSSRPVGGVFLTKSAYESVVPRDSPAFLQSNKASSARNSESSSESASPSSSSGSASRSVKSTRTARKNASSPYPTYHASRTRISQPQSVPEYHVTSLGRWTDPLPLSSRPVGGVFLTNSAYESVVRPDSPAFSQSTDHDLEAIDGPARDAEPVDAPFEDAVHKSSPSSPVPFAQPTPYIHPSPSAPSFEQPFIAASAAVQSPPHVPPPSPQPQAEPSAPVHIAQTTLPDYASPLRVPHESSTLFGEFEGSFAGYAEPYTHSNDSDTPLTLLDIATFADTMGSSHEPAPHIGYTELSLPPGIPVASDLFALYDEPFVPTPSYEEPLIPIPGFYDADDLFAGTRFGNAYWRNEVYVGGFSSGGLSAY